jgi:hypothetical protein
VIMTGFYWLYSLPSRLTMDAPQREEADAALEAAWKAQTDSFYAGLGDLKTGGIQAKDALGTIFGDMFESLGPVVDLMKSGIGGNIDQVMQYVAELAERQEAQDRAIVMIYDALSDLSPALRSFTESARTLYAADYAMQTAKGTFSKRKEAARSVIKGAARRHAAQEQKVRRGVQTQVGKIVGVISSDAQKAMNVMANTNTLTYQE